MVKSLYSEWDSVETFDLLVFFFFFVSLTQVGE